MGIADTVVGKVVVAAVIVVIAVVVPVAAVALGQESPQHHQTYR